MGRIDTSDSRTFVVATQYHHGISEITSKQFVEKYMQAFSMFVSEE